MSSDDSPLIHVREAVQACQDDKRQPENYCLNLSAWMCERVLRHLDGEVERLQRELTEAIAVIDRVHAAEKTFLSRTVDAEHKVAELTDAKQRIVDTHNRLARQWIYERDKAEAELARQKPVIEAVQLWRDQCEAYTANHDTLIAVVDVFNSGKQAKDDASD